MDYTQAFAISAAGMTLERTRADVAALNLANANTVQGADGTTFRPLRVIARAMTAEGTLPFGQLVSQGLVEQPGAGVQPPLLSIEPADAPPRMVYEPSHPLADERGFVAYAGVDTATEMVSMMGATRAYEANVAAMNTARTLALKALEIGGAS